ncbi:MAG: GAF domain-containing protein [Oligoflexales bacterium]
MISAPLAPDEEERIKKLQELKILDTEIDKNLDSITKLAAEICETKISLVSLVDRDRQWFKSRFGIDATETPREYAFCAHAILQNDLFEIEDSREDERFSDNPLVTGPPNVIFYAGYPIEVSGGHKIGTLCAIDSKPHKLNEFQKKTLKALARQVSQIVQLRNKLDQFSEAQAKDAVLALAVTYNHQFNNKLAASMMALELVENKIGPVVYKNIMKPLVALVEQIKKIEDTLKKSGFEYEPYVGDTKMIKLE